MTQEVLNWLRGFAPFAGLITEFLGVNSGCCGLFPQGEQVVDTRKDLLGNATLTCRYTYQIRYRAVPGTSAAAVGEDFGSWLYAQNLGAQVTAQWKNARLISRDQTGTAVYQGELVLTYQREMQGG